MKTTTNIIFVLPFAPTAKEKKMHGSISMTLQIEEKYREQLITLVRRQNI